MESPVPTVKLCPQTSQKKSRNSLFRRQKWHCSKRSLSTTCSDPWTWSFKGSCGEKQRTKHGFLFRCWYKQAKGESLNIFWFWKDELKGFDIFRYFVVISWWQAQEIVLRNGQELTQMVRKCCFLANKGCEGIFVCFLCLFGQCWSQALGQVDHCRSFPTEIICSEVKKIFHSSLNSGFFSLFWSNSPKSVFLPVQLMWSESFKRSHSWFFP